MKEKKRNEKSSHLISQSFQFVEFISWDTGPWNSLRSMAIHTQTERSMDCRCMRERESAVWVLFRCAFTLINSNLWNHLQQLSDSFNMDQWLVWIRIIIMGEYVCVCVINKYFAFCVVFYIIIFLICILCLVSYKSYLLVRLCLFCSREWERNRQRPRRHACMHENCKMMINFKRLHFRISHSLHTPIHCGMMIMILTVAPVHMKCQHKWRHTRNITANVVHSDWANEKSAHANNETKSLHVILPWYKRLYSERCHK